MALATLGVANMANSLKQLVGGNMIEQIVKLGAALENLAVSMSTSGLAPEFASIVSEMSRFENAITATGVANLQPFIAEMNDLANNAEQIKSVLNEARGTAVAVNNANNTATTMAAALSAAMSPLASAIANNTGNTNTTPAAAPKIDVHVELDGVKVSKNVETRIDRKLVRKLG